MSIVERASFETRVEAIAREFHIAYERYAPLYNWETQMRSRVMWEDIPQENKALMIAVVKKLLIDGIIDPGEKLIAEQIN